MFGLHMSLVLLNFHWHQQIFLLSQQFCRTRQCSG